MYLMKILCQVEEGEMNVYKEYFGHFGGINV